MASLFSTLQRSLKGLLILVPVLIGLVIVSPAEAARWDAETLTVPSNPEGTQVTFSEQEINMLEDEEDISNVVTHSFVDESEWHLKKFVQCTPRVSGLSEIK